MCSTGKSIHKKRINWSNYKNNTKRMKNTDIYWTVRIKICIINNRYQKNRGISMGENKKYKGTVYQSLALISQFGINMLVPICLCSVLGWYLDKWFQTSWLFIVLFFVGALAGFRNVFILAKKIYETPAEDGYERVRQKSLETEENIGSSDCIRLQSETQKSVRLESEREGSGRRESDRNESDKKENQ